MEELNTDKKEEISNISFDDIYRAIGSLELEHQRIILNNYKFPELYNLLVNYGEYEKYLTGLLNHATAIINVVGALSSLRKGTIIQSHERRQGNIPESLIQAYDNLTENEQQEFCRNILTKQDFLAESVRTIQRYFENAVEK